MATNLQRPSARLVDAAVWLQTAGAAAPWQLLGGSDMSFLSIPDASTMVIEPLVFYPVEDMLLEPPTLSDEAVKEQIPLFSREDDPLQAAILNLLSYSPKPDQPGDEDIKPALRYSFPG